MRVRSLLACALLLALSGTSVAQTTRCDEPIPQSLSNGNEGDKSGVDHPYNVNDNAYLMPGRCGVERDPYERTVSSDEMDDIIPY